MKTRQNTQPNAVFSKIARTRYLIPLSIAGLLSSACGMATFDGEADLLQLQVVHPDSAIMSSLGAVLAEGTRVEMRAIVKESQQPGLINKASSTDKTIVNVTGFDADRVTIDALKAGHTEIDLSVKNADDETFDDIIPLEVRKVASTVVTHACEDAVLLTNSNVDMRYSMRDENNKRLTGYGFYPLSFEPAGPQVDQDYQFVEFIRIQTGPNPGTYALQSTLPTSDLEITVINPEDVTKLSAHNYDPDADPTITQLDSGTSPVASFAIETESKSVCGNSDYFSVSSLTPETCSGQLNALGTLYVLSVTPLKAGDCTLDVQLLDNDKSVLLSQQHSVSITS